jgi:hypothetical protein
MYTNALGRAQAQHALLDICSWLLNGSQVEDAPCTCSMSLKVHDLGRKLLDAQDGDEAASAVLFPDIVNCKVHGRTSAVCEIAMPSSLPNGLRSASPALCSSLLSAISAYLPSSTDGSNERTLSDELLRLASNTTAAPLKSAPAQPHPMRGVPLANGLNSRIWTSSAAAPMRHSTRPLHLQRE